MGVGRLKHLRRVALILAFGFALLWASGCASPEPATTQRRHKFIRTQSENQVTLQWESKPGRTYSVLYATDLNRAGAWRAVPGYENYMARDGTARITFTAPVPGAKTYYRLEEAASRR
jgi:hypothetical protein